MTGREPQRPSPGDGEAPPAISVVIPTYERAHTVGRAIASVLAQTVSDFELIVIDDGSRDDTAGVVERFEDPRIRYMRQENRGRSAARNRGARAAAAPWVTFLDSDDEAAAGWLEGFLQTRRRSPEARVVCCGVTMKIDRPALGLHREATRLPSDLGPMYEHRRGFFIAGSFALERRLFLEVGGFDEVLDFSENTELALRLTARCERDGLEIATIDRSLVTMHHQRPAAGGKQSVERLRSAERVLERHGDRYRRRSPSGYANYKAIAGVHAARLGDFSTARRHLLGAVAAYPWHLKNYARLTMAILSPLGRRLWSRSGSRPP